MVKTPDISELLGARADFVDLQKATNEAGKEVIRIENKVIQLYKAAGISQEDCDHPVTKYVGGGENECLCCDKYGV